MQRRLSMAALALLFTCGASNAQTAVSSSGMGATSPLGMPGGSGTSNSSITTTPLGATEIDPGGLGTTVCSANRLDQRDERHVTRFQYRWNGQHFIHFLDL
ncbi:hypothetical protein ACVWZL_005912 [Bradyrhizobium sp. GM2.4]